MLLAREVGLEILSSDGEDVARMTSTFMADWATGTVVSPVPSGDP